MHKLNYYLLLLLICFTPFKSSIFAQENNSLFLSNKFSDFNFGNFYSGTKNFVEFTYGIGKLKHKNLDASFNKPILSEIKLGKRSIKPISGFKILHFNDNYLFSSYFEENFQKSNKISFKMWRFGFGYREGYGYRFGKLALMPYYHLGLVWNKSDISLPPSIPNEIFFISSQDRETLSYYNSEVKFGTANTAGIDLKVSSLLNFGVSYETSVVFPYHKAWKQLGSFFIESFAQVGVNFLTEGVIIKYAPSIAPIFYFLVKNGLSYYLYTKKQDKMNWPFETIEPLTFEAVKLNLKLTF